MNISIYVNTYIYLNDAQNPSEYVKMGDTGTHSTLYYASIKLKCHFLQALIFKKDVF